MERFPVNSSIPNKNGATVLNKFITVSLYLPNQMCYDKMHKDEEKEQYPFFRFQRAAGRCETADAKRGTRLGVAARNLRLNLHRK